MGSGGRPPAWVALYCPVPPGVASCLMFLSFLESCFVTKQICTTIQKSASFRLNEASFRTSKATFGAVKIVLPSLLPITSLLLLFTPIPLAPTHRIYSLPLTHPPYTNTTTQNTRRFCSFLLSFCAISLWTLGPEQSNGHPH